MGNNNIYKNAIESLPMLFDIPLQFSSQDRWQENKIFEPLKKIIDFNQAYVFFLNSDSITLKYESGEQNKYIIGSDFCINDKIKNDLFSVSNMILEPENELVNILDIKNNKSFLILKLVIRSTVYGFVLLCKEEESYYTEQHVEIAPAISSVISYKIKDIELSDVFQSQIKTLADNVIETKIADKVKTEFLTNISHELRTPLNAIIGFSEILANGFYGELNEKQSEFVKDINVSGIHLLGMINEILDISKIEAHAMTLNRTEFSIALAVEEVVNVVKPLSDKKNIVIEKNVDEGIIFADFQKIRQILYNLLSNAIKFSPENDKIVVNAKFDKIYLIIEIKDNGIGIAPSNQKRIFEKFVQLENAYNKKESSTGLGLIITKELTEMHHGEITVESDLNKGATFIVKLPVRQ